MIFVVFRILSATAGCFSLGNRPGKKNIYFARIWSEILRKSVRKKNISFMAFGTPRKLYTFIKICIVCNHFLVY